MFVWRDKNNRILVYLLSRAMQAMVFSLYNTGKMRTILAVMHSKTDLLSAKFYRHNRVLKACQNINLVI